MFSSGTYSETRSGYTFSLKLGKARKTELGKSLSSGVLGDKFLYSGAYVLRLFLDIFFWKNFVLLLTNKNIQKQNKNFSAV
jgi:hypothetical protein